MTKEEMNEKIKQLRKEAWEILNHDFEAVGQGRVVTYEEHLELHYAKFAKLLILECASQVRFTDLLKCNEDSDEEILLQASVQLKQHFGVE